MGEIRAGLDLDISKVDSKLIKADLKAKETDDKARVVKARVKAIQMQLKQAEVKAKQVASEVRSSIRGIASSATRTAAVAGAAFALSDVGMPEAISPLANIAGAFATGTLFGGTPVTGAVLATATAVMEAINWGRRAYQRAERAAAAAQQAKDLIARQTVEFGQKIRDEERKREEALQKFEEEVGKQVREADYRARIAIALDAA